MKGIYNKHTKLDFGFYKGYDLGVVYVCDPKYIEWCVNHIECFYIEDLNELMGLGVLNKDLDWQYKMPGNPGIVPYLTVFSSFGEMAENINLGKNKYKFSNSTVNKNESKNIDGLSYENDENINFENEDDYFQTWGQTRGQEMDLCDSYDSCYECPYANSCF